MKDFDSETTENAKHREHGVSVVIASYNSARRIGETLLHLSRQEGIGDFPAEILLIDNNSNDGTGEIAAKAWKELGEPFPMRVILHEKPGVTGTRLKGFAESRYRIGLICDDDNWLARNYLQRVMTIFEQKPNVGVVCGISHAEPESILPEWFEDSASLFACGDRGLQNGVLTGIDAWVWGAGMAFRLDVFDRLLEAGFVNAALGRTSASMLCGEDVEWCHWFTLAGYGILHDDSLELSHFIEDRKLTEEYRFNLIEGIRLSNKLLDDYYPVLRGTEIRNDSSFSKFGTTMKLLAKFVLRKNYQPEAIALMPSTDFLLSDGVRKIHANRDRFLGDKD
jgi:glycosyltransferase involved in cell wall biosynthesis